MLNNEQVKAVKMMRSWMIEYDMAKADGDKEAMEKARENVIALRKNGFPVTHGESMAIRAYTDGDRDENGIIILSDFGFDSDADDLMNVFDALGITELVVTDSSTALLGWLFNVISRGWNVVGIWVQPAKNEFENTRKALRIKKVF